MVRGMRKIYIILFLVFFSGVSSANVILNGTRYIYRSDDREIFVQLRNVGDTEELVQSWVDDGDIKSTPETSKAPFFLSPPVVKIPAMGGQQVSIQQRGTAHLPRDRESVFYLNVLDIPPVPSNLIGRNIMQFAIRSRVKLFYRPSSISENINSAAKKLSVKHKGNNLVIKNISPLHLTIDKIKTQKNNTLDNSSLMIAPFSEGVVTLRKNVGVTTGTRVKITYIDDFGGFNEIHKNIEG